MNIFARSPSRLLAIIFVIAFSLSLAVLAEAGERGTANDPAPNPSPVGAASTPEPSAFGLDTALGLVGLPGMSPAADDDESTYEKAWRMQNGPNGTTRLTYGERYHRNPDGSYGPRSSSRWDGGNVADNLLEHALSAGSGYFSSWAEGFLSGYGKARLSFRLNDEGDVTGAGDFLMPLYDSEYSTFFTQIGLRTMPNDRVIGNFGLGQRFFPVGNFALGYNVFLDQDFTRNHTRGGAGVEAWYDWLRLSANYYTPLSGWKGSKDYDSRLVEERPAEGYDARLTGYLPFYRNLAVTGAFEQWKGDHVGSFGSDDVVQKDPKVWSYGLEWTPVPAFSTSLTQRHSGSQKETQMGITFNYLFGMDWEDQLSPAVVTEMRTVDGSRHDFVNRQNEIILAYRAKEGAFNIIPRGTGGANIFVFQITNGFGESVAGQRVTASLPAGVVDSGNGVYTTDGNGLITIGLITVPPAAVPTVATLTAGKTSRTFTLGSASTVPSGTLIFSSSGEHEPFVTTNDYQSTIDVTLDKYVDDNGEQTLPGGAHVVWSVKSVSNPSAPWWKRSATAKNGLTWGAAADGTSSWANDDVENAAAKSTIDTVQITDVVGSRSVTLEATVCVGGSGGETTETACTTNSGTWYTGEKTVTFGDGPLSVFSQVGSGTRKWAEQSADNSSTGFQSLSSPSDFPAANFCGGAVNSQVTTTGNSGPATSGFTPDSGNDDWSHEYLPISTSSDYMSRYAEQSNLPTTMQLMAVAKHGTQHPTIMGKGAAYAADWQSTLGSTWVWSGEVDHGSGDFYARVVDLDDGYSFWDNVYNTFNATVCVP